MASLRTISLCGIVREDQSRAFLTLIPSVERWTGRKDLIERGRTGAHTSKEN